MGSLLVGLVAALVGGLFVVMASRPASDKGATRARTARVVPAAGARENRVAGRAPARVRVAAPAATEVHTPLGAAVRLGGLLVVAGAFCAGMLAVVLALGVTVLLHSLQ